jgi:hypothetical protein
MAILLFGRFYSTLLMCITDYVGGPMKVLLYRLIFFLYLFLGEAHSRNSLEISTMYISNNDEPRRRVSVQGHAIIPIRLAILVFSSVLISSQIT